MKFLLVLIMFFSIIGDMTSFVSEVCLDAENTGQDSVAEIYDNISKSPIDDMDMNCPSTCHIGHEHNVFLETPFLVINTHSEFRLVVFLDNNLLHFSDYIKEVSRPPIFS